MMKKTRPVESKSDWTCPIHNKEVEKRIRRRRNEDGTGKFAGTYYGCPFYNECGYYVSGDMRVSIVT